MSRNDGRKPDQLRSVTADAAFLEQPHGVVLWSQGKTKVLCTATVQEGVPRWLYRSGRGWMTAEYSLLPASTGDRTDREAARGKQGGRTVEIQRLIGRSLRSVVDLQAMGERQITIDCDVIQADGGTRTASITGAWVALADCFAWMKARDMFKAQGNAEVLRDNIAAVSCGVYNNTAVLDLDYAEDSDAETDANFVMSGNGNIVEIQATAEKTPFSEDQFLALLALARKGIGKLVDLQKMAVG